MQPNQSEIVDNGIFYTPEAVAKELAIGVNKRLTKQTKLRILDPSSGAGALLRAVEEQVDGKHEFHGCDVFQSPEFPKGKNWKFKQSDFFEYEGSNKFNVIVTNPPYIQYGRLSVQTRDSLYQRYSKDLSIHKNSDLWLYFILKSISHLISGGILAAVIPWSFLEADFAHKFRTWLASQFGSINVLVLRDRHFETTEKRVLLLWLSNYGHEAKSIKIGFSENVEHEHNYIDVDSSAWSSAGLMANIGFQTESLLAQAAASKFQNLSAYASVHIGVVTGANAFFILEKKRARELGFGENATIPILTTTDDLQSLDTISGKGKVLIQFPRLSKRRSSYIESGAELKLPERSHCERREVWYDVDPGVVPDAIFTYRVSTIPYMALNSSKTQCTNTLHKIFFNEDVTDDQKKWITLSILSSVAQLSLEHHGRHYGNGILKIEPSALKNALVYATTKKMPATQFEAVSQLLKNGHKEKASEMATSILRKHINLSDDYWDQVKATLTAIRIRRK
jgi:adenine-specific DNA methylase